MTNFSSPLEIRIEKATKDEWESILGLLDETGSKEYLSGKETYKTFYTTRLNNDTSFVNCFSIEVENNIGILKSFAIKKELQGKGLGKIITTKLTEITRQLALKKLYASSWEAPGFWIKTNLKEIKEESIVDSFFLHYVQSLQKDFPILYRSVKHFVLIIND